MNKKFWALMLVLPLCTFCGGKDNPKPEPEPEVNPEIVISGDSEFNVGCESGSGTLTFTSNVDWTATPDDAWLTVSPESGKASKTPVTVTFTYGQNPNLKKGHQDLRLLRWFRWREPHLGQLGDRLARR